LTHSIPAPEERSVDWIGSALKDLRAFPETPRRNIGFALSTAQYGGKHPSAKPWIGDGAGVYEIVEDYDGDTYRAVYTVHYAEVIYVVHCFQKKSPKGIKTAEPDKKLIAKRLKMVRDLHEKTYGKAKK
jgi:phage-related protein